MWQKRKTCGLNLGVEVELSSVGFHQWFTTKALEVPWLRLKSKSGGLKWRGGIQASLTAQEWRSDRVGRSNRPGGAV